MSAPNALEPLYDFGFGVSGTRRATPEAVGNKAMNLIRMADAGLPVPPGFVLPTTLCREYYRLGRRLPEGTADLLARGIREVEEATGLTFGGERRPLLVAVRSGAPVSMPGMMDTLLNIGLCGRTLPGLVRMTGNPRHAWDSYRRLIQAYAEVVDGLPPDPFERALGEILRREAVPSLDELDVGALRGLTRDFLDRYETEKGCPFPQEPPDQLIGAVEAVLRSWQSPRAVEYRRLHRLDDRMGTAVTIQAMVFGNMGGTSGSGVAFTRDPATGEDTLYLDYLPNAQGEDVVSGRCPVNGQVDLQRAMPELYRQLRGVGRQLEWLFGDAQDFEFTVQEGRLYLLQAREAKRTAWAALRIACDLVTEGLIDATTARARLADYDLASIRRTRLATSDQCRPIGQGFPASPGVAIGEIASDPERAIHLASIGRPPILARMDIATADLAALAASAGILTARGTRTSHAAVVARQLNKPCVVGCRDLVLLGDGRGCRIGDQSLGEGDVLSLDGQSGLIYSGRLEVVLEQPIQYLREVQHWRAELGEAAPPSPGLRPGSAPEEILEQP